MKSVILIGDSIRMGYQLFVAQELKDAAEVWGPEQNGGTSRNVLAHLDEWVLQRPSDIVHLNCGLHDLARDADGEGGFKGPRVGLEEYEQNVREILSRIQDAGRKILWASTTPVNEANHRIKGFERLESDVKQHNLVAARVAQELKIPINDLNGVVEECGPDRVLLPDGVHFSEEGSKELGRAVADFLRAQW